MLILKVEDEDVIQGCEFVERCLGKTPEDEQAGAGLERGGHMRVSGGRRGAGDGSERGPGVGVGVVEGGHVVAGIVGVDASEEEHFGVEDGGGVAADSFWAGERDGNLFPHTASDVGTFVIPDCKSAIDHPLLSQNQILRRRLPPKQNQSIPNLHHRMRVPRTRRLHRKHPLHLKPLPLKRIKIPKTDHLQLLVHRQPPMHKEPPQRRVKAVGVVRPVTGHSPLQRLGLPPRLLQV